MLMEDSVDGRADATPDVIGRLFLVGAISSCALVFLLLKELLT